LSFFTENLWMVGIAAVFGILVIVGMFMMYDATNSILESKRQEALMLEEAGKQHCSEPGFYNEHVVICERLKGATS